MNFLPPEILKNKEGVNNTPKSRPFDMKIF